MNRPLPPESTTPACFRTGSNSGVCSTVSSAAFTAVSRRSIASRFEADPRPASVPAAIPLATVKIVPSTGLTTPLYAVSRISANALTIVSASSVSWSCTPRANPRHNCERITPEFPRAPINAPLATMPAILPKCFSPESLTSLYAEVRVSSMFVPVSPSGTGNTLREFTICWFVRSQVTPASTNRFSD